MGRELSVALINLICTLGMIAMSLVHSFSMYNLSCIPLVPYVVYVHSMVLAQPQES